MASYFMGDMYAELIDRYANDSFCKVECIEISPRIKQVIEIDYDTHHVYHYEGKSFKEIFYRTYFFGLSESIEGYDYYFYEYPELAKDFIKEWNKQEWQKDIPEYGYLKYIAKWWKTHTEGNPVCYEEWLDNEGDNDNV